MHSEFPTESSYRDQREQFLAAANAAGATLTSYAHPRCGPFGEPLSTTSPYSVIRRPNVGW